MDNYLTQAELYHKGWSTLRCLRLGTPDCVLLDGVPYPANQYPALRAQHGVKAQRGWATWRVQAAEN